ncbi:hypothetical protein ES695_01460 [Candidatus Atribacteria bacterium 1244-E10-H5-B2]|nr:MAG: hypothetical protein ES695_01460 [Candidatus Atribacteria bacterium 1244-E10-H5-B2]
MIYSIDCTARVNAQDPDYPTFKKIDCTAHCNANENWYGKIIDCTATITSIIVAACKSWEQGIRLKVLIDDVDVSEAIIGSLSIQHDKNKISTFTLNLGDTQYSPRTNGHIDLDKPIVITVYINRQEQKLFTGSIDEPEAENTPAFRVIVSGRDYGKKLLDKRMTLISIQNLVLSPHELKLLNMIKEINAKYDALIINAREKFPDDEIQLALYIETLNRKRRAIIASLNRYIIIKRNEIIKYIAEQAGITNVDIPEMGRVTIDNSFQDQSLWDMVQKEAMVEQYWIKFDEDGVMKLELDEIKSDETLYPTPDWAYNEDRFIRLGYKKSRVGINKIMVLGKTTQRRVPVFTEKMITPEVDYTTPVVLFSDTLSFADGEFIDYDANNNYTKTVGDFTLKIHSYGSGGYGGNVGIYVGTKSREITNSYIITSKTGTIGGDAFLRRVTDSMSAGGTIQLKGMSWTISRGQGSLGGYPSNFKKGSEGGAFTFEIAVYGYLNRKAEPATYEIDVTYETRYDQISAQVIDPNSIAKYGERDGGSIVYPLLETVEQCEAVGKKIIRNNHKLGISNFEIPFNPLLKTGQTVALSDKKIGLTKRYLVEGVGHGIDIDDEGKIKARTQVRGICYA